MSEYAERDLLALSPYYERHVSAMTCEELHSKSDIAAELAWRDKQRDDLLAALKNIKRHEKTVRGDFSALSAVYRMARATIAAVEKGK